MFVFLLLLTKNVGTFVCCRDRIGRFLIEALIILTGAGHRQSWSIA
jgi:hypothetical protein